MERSEFIATLLESRAHVLRLGRHVIGQHPEIDISGPEAESPNPATFKERAPPADVRPRVPLPTLTSQRRGQDPVSSGVPEANRVTRCTGES